MERKRHPARFVYWAVVLLLVALVLPASLYAQETRGRITGRVTDATKGTIPGATVTVTDPTRNTTVTVTTNEQGLFQANYLLPGTYKVTVELAGLQDLRPGEGTSSRSTETRDLAIVLEVGALAESVSVVAEISDGEHGEREPGAGRGSGAPRVSAAHPRRPVQDHGTRAGPGPHGKPAAGPPVRADAHRRLRLPAARAATAATC